MAISAEAWRLELAAFKEQRRALVGHLEVTPPLKRSLTNEHGIRKTRADAVSKAVEETGLAVFPEACPSTMEQAMNPEFLPEQS